MYQVEKAEHFQHMPFEFSGGIKAWDPHRTARIIYGENVVGESTARNWFSRFKVT